MLKEGVPGKQIMASQLLQGLANGDFKNLKVTQDLQAASSVLLSGRAEDILKVAALPNVQRSDQKLSPSLVSRR